MTNETKNGTKDEKESELTNEQLNEQLTKEQKIEFVRKKSDQEYTSQLSTYTKPTENGVMSEEEKKLWHICDIRLNNRLQTLINYALIAERSGNWKPLIDSYKNLVKRYERIDISKFDLKFPVDTILKTYGLIRGLAHVIKDCRLSWKSIYDGLLGPISEFKDLSKEFSTDRYMLYRSLTNEAERKG
jgi:hypothetical protein